MKEGKEFEFRVIAVNKGGNGEPSEASRTQKAKARFLKPRIDKKTFVNITLKAGQTATIEANYVAEPQPTYVWSTENGSEFTEDDRTKMSIEPTKVRIVVEKAKRSDTKKYIIKLTNDSGSDTANIDLVVLGAPGRPKGPLEIVSVRKYDLICIHLSRSKTCRNWDSRVIFY